MGVRKVSAKARRWAAVASGRRALKLMNSAPKVKTVLLRTLSSSTEGRRRARSESLNSRSTFKSKAKRAGPRPTLRGRSPVRPTEGRRKASTRRGSSGAPGPRQRMRRGSPSKEGRSLPTSSRLRSEPPSVTLKGAPEARRRTEARRSLPRSRGASSAAASVKRWRRSRRLRARSARKSPTRSALEVLTTPSSIRRESV